MDEEDKSSPDLFANMDKEDNGSVSDRRDSKGEEAVSQDKEVSVSDNDEAIVSDVSSPFHGFKTYKIHGAG